MSAELPQLPRVIAVPSDRLWLDPPFVARMLYTQVTDVVLAGASTVQAVGFNGARWAIYFLPGTAAPTSPRAAPWSDSSVVPGWEVDDAGVLRFTLTLDGPLVTGEWYVSGGGPGTIRVVEIIRQS